MSQSVNIDLAVSVESGTQVGGQVTKNRIDVAKILQLLNGTGAGNANKSWYGAARSIAGSGTDVLDLAGVLTDAFGATLTFTKVKAIVVLPAAANGSTLKLGGGTNPIVSLFGAGTDKITLRPGGLFVLVATDATGYAVIATTGDNITITNDHASAATYDILIVGE